jgi:hypothetical protein
VLSAGVSGGIGGIHEKRRCRGILMAAITGVQLRLCTLGANHVEKHGIFNATMFLTLILINCLARTRRLLPL